MRGRTQRTSWRTSCFHWEGVSVRLLRLAVPLLWSRSRCTHAHMLKFANRWKKNKARDGRIKEKEGVRRWKVCACCVCYCLRKSLYVSCKLLVIQFADAATCLKCAVLFWTQTWELGIFSPSFLSFFILTLLHLHDFFLTYTHTYTHSYLQGCWPAVALFTDHETAFIRVMHEKT